jgi:tetratricopeptide (TPR) repeat protein
VARVLLAGLFGPYLLAAASFAAQDKAPPPKTDNPPAVVEQEPPEEDESLIPKVYALNPLEASRNITAGNFYFKKGNYRAAARRYLEATRWDPGSSEGFLRLGEADEKVRDLAGAKDAYTKYLTLTPDAKNADSLKKKIEKWPASPAKK